MEKALVEFVLNSNQKSQNFTRSKPTHLASNFSSLTHKSFEGIRPKSFEITSYSDKKSKVIYEPYNVLTWNARPFSASINLNPVRKSSKIYRSDDDQSMKVACWNLHEGAYKTRPPTANWKLMIGNNAKLRRENP